MTSIDLIALAEHLWQSTLFAAAVAFLTLLLRKNSARARYCLWLAASAKFLVPFAWFTVIGTHIPWSQGHGTAPAFLSLAGPLAADMTRLSGLGPRPPAAPTQAFAGAGELVPITLALIWALGALALAARWRARWLRLQRALSESTPTSLSFVAPVRSSSLQIEPAVVGVFHPVLLIPRGLDQRLTSEELCAILAHERCHVTWQDNLAATLHMLVEALFWFHPLTWWIGTRLIAERERACDEQVLAEGHPPESYAEGILKVCEQYLQAHLACAAGISGADLRHRIRAIVRNDPVVRLSAVQKLLISLAACMTIAAPIVVGALTSPQAHAQSGTSSASEPAFRHVSIQIVPGRDRGITQPCPGYASRPDGRVTIGRCSLRRFIANLYGVSESQVIGRDWSQEPLYEITADDTITAAADRAAAYRELPAMMRNLLTRQFGLVVKRERRQVDGYVLSVAPAGSKLKSYSGPEWKIAGWMSPEDGVTATGYSVSALKHFLQMMYRVPVVDQTGLRGIYEYKARWTPPSPGALPAPDAVGRALEEQLGLRLEARRVTVDVIDVVGLKSPAEIVTQR